VALVRACDADLVSEAEAVEGDIVFREVDIVYLLKVTGLWIGCGGKSVIDKRRQRGTFSLG